MPQIHKTIHLQGLITNIFKSYCYKAYPTKTKQTKKMAKKDIKNRNKQFYWRFGLAHKLKM